MTSAAGPKRFTILVPLPFHRGEALGSVPTWTHQQAFPRDDYEVVLLSDGSDPRLVQQLARLLTPLDRIETYPGRHEFQMYTQAAAQARGDFLVITEGHCQAEPEFLVEMDRFLRANPTFRVACGKSLALTANRIARMDAFWVEHGFAQPWQPGNYERVIRHALAVERLLFLEIGGFDPETGYYSERPLGAALCDRGVSVGSVPRARVRHHYRTGLLELWPFVKDMVQGEYAFRRKTPARYLSLYFGAAEEPRRPTAEFSQAVCRAFGSVLLGQRGHVTFAWERSLWKHFLRHLPAALLGQSWYRAARFLSVARSLAACWLQYFNEGNLRLAYQELWQNMVRLARLDVPDLEGPPAAFDQQRRSRWSVDEWPTDRLFGAHGPELYQGVAFRWTEPVFMLRLPAVSGPTELVLETRRLMPLPAKPLVFLDGSLLDENRVVVESDAVRCFLPVSKSNGVKGPVVVVVCRPFQARSKGILDYRVLGLPLFGIGARTSGEQDLSLDLRKAS
jgi:hypothetical protein